MVSFPPVSPPRSYTTPSPHPYAPHAQPISFFSISSPAQYWVSSTNQLAPRYAISSIPPLPRPSSVQIFSSTPCFQTTSASFPPAMSATKFHTHTKNRQNYALQNWSIKFLSAYVQKVDKDNKVTENQRSSWVAAPNCAICQDIGGHSVSRKRPWQKLNQSAVGKVRNIIPRCAC